MTGQPQRNTGFQADASGSLPLLRSKGQHFRTEILKSIRHAQHSFRIQTSFRSQRSPLNEAYGGGKEMRALLQVLL